MDGYRDFADYQIEKLKDPQEATAYLDLTLEEYEEDGDADALLLAQHRIAQAQSDYVPTSS